MKNIYLGGRTARKLQTRVRKSQNINRRRTFKNQNKKQNKTGIKGRGKFLKGWKTSQPGYHDRNIMIKKCGKKCFLGPNKSFPICRRNTCKIDRRGIESAYIRAREYMTIKGTPKYQRISRKAYKMLY